MSASEESDKASVFSPVDQQEMIAKIASVGDDDLSGCFFGDFPTDAETATTGSFDNGGHDDGDNEQGPIGPFADASTMSVAAPFVGPASAVEPGPAAAAPAPSELAAGGPLGHDAAARQAFILGGPGAIAGD